MRKNNFIYLRILSISLALIALLLTIKQELDYFPILLIIGYQLSLLWIVSLKGIKGESRNVLIILICFSILFLVVSLFDKTTSFLPKIPLYATLIYTYCVDFREKNDNNIKKH